MLSPFSHAVTHALPHRDNGHIFIFNKASGLQTAVKAEFKVFQIFL